ncbi:MAG: hypothetical protein LAN64_06785 [Acidobacteriia bacterium]|nr:hypothetical protein [Terriglobia bacterium]
MRTLLLAGSLFVASLAAHSQVAPAGDITGKLELAEIPPGAVPTPVEMLPVTIRSLATMQSITADPDKTGKFVLKNVPAGQYSLSLPFPGLIRIFAMGNKALNPDRFGLEPDDTAPLQIVVSLRESTAVVDVHGIPTNAGKVDGLLFPDDPYITPRYSGRSLPVLNGRNEFRGLSPGKYRVFIYDHDYWRVVVSPPMLNALRERAAIVELPEQGQASVEANYIDTGTILEAFRHCTKTEAAFDCPPASYLPEFGSKAADNPTSKSPN